MTVCKFFNSVFLKFQLNALPIDEFVGNLCLRCSQAKHRVNPDNPASGNHSCSSQHPGTVTLRKSYLHLCTKREEGSPEALVFVDFERYSGKSFTCVTDCHFFFFFFFLPANMLVDTYPSFSPFELSSEKVDQLYFFFQHFKKKNNNNNNQRQFFPIEHNVNVRSVFHFKAMHFHLIWKLLMFISIVKNTLVLF